MTIPWNIAPSNSSQPKFLNRAHYDEDDNTDESDNDDDFCWPEDNDAISLVKRQTQTIQLPVAFAAERVGPYSSRNAFLSDSSHLVFTTIMIFRTFLPMLAAAVLLSPNWNNPLDQSSPKYHVESQRITACSILSWISSPTIISRCIAMLLQASPAVMLI